MLIPVAGMDPSFNNWGIAECNLDLNQGYLDITNCSVISPDDLKGKQVRVNSNDMHKAEQIWKIIYPICLKAKIIFIEMPVGTQSAAGMKAYGVCIGIVAAIRGMGIPVIEVTPDESKKVFTGIKNASKQQMIDQAVKLYPNANYPTWGGKMTSKAEHVADAIASIHAGVLTPTFQNLMRLFEKV